MSADNAGRNWDWLDDDADIVVPEQPQIAVYSNPAGAVVLRQPAAVHDEDDDVIFFSPNHARAVAAAILEAAGLVDADIAEPAPEPAPCATKPKDATAAERQRRRRARQKKEPTLDIDRDVTVVTRDESAA